MHPLSLSPSLSLCPSKGGRERDKRANSPALHLSLSLFLSLSPALTHTHTTLKPGAGDEAENEAVSACILSSYAASPALVNPHLGKVLNPHLCKAAKECSAQPSNPVLPLLLQPSRLVLYLLLPRRSRDDSLDSQKKSKRKI